MYIWWYWALWKALTGVLNMYEGVQAVEEALEQNGHMLREKRLVSEQGQKYF